MLQKLNYFSSRTPVMRHTRHADVLVFVLNGKIDEEVVFFVAFDICAEREEHSNDVVVAVRSGEMKWCVSLLVLGVDEMRVNFEEHSC